MTKDPTEKLRDNDFTTTSMATVTKDCAIEFAFGNNVVAEI